MREDIVNSLKEAQNALDKFVSTPATIDAIESAAKTMKTALDCGNKILACGNGGSLCDATHFAEELTARFRKNRQPFPAIAINDPAYLTCTVNDFSPDIVFSRYVEGVGKKGDVLLALSTSGNSKNVLEAAKTARKMGITVVALTGKGGGELAKLADIEIRAPMSEYSDRVQEIHIKVIHILVQETAG